jgi:uncharacterized zinc-type alcohol dehydrogenase-like protein
VVCARALGAHHFVVTREAAQLERARSSFDLTLNTVSAPLDLDTYVRLLRRDGTMVLLGVPPEAPTLHAFALIGGCWRVAGSLIGGIAETQEMLDFCGANDLMADMEVIPVSGINGAYERMLRGDVCRLRPSEGAASSHPGRQARGW